MSRSLDYRAAGDTLGCRRTVSRVSSAAKSTARKRLGHRSFSNLPRLRRLNRQSGDGMTLGDGRALNRRRGQPKPNLASLPARLIMRANPFGAKGAARLEHQHGFWPLLGLHWGIPHNLLNTRLVHSELRQVLFCSHVCRRHLSKLLLHLLKGKARL
jgi:hypothetical protein